MQYIKKDLANVIISPRNPNVFENFKENNFSQSLQNQKNTRNVNYTKSGQGIGIQEQDKRNEYNS